MSMPVTQNLISILMQESHYILLAIPQGWTSNERKQLTFQPGRILFYQNWGVHYQH